MIIHHIIIIIIVVTDSMYTSCLVHASQTTKVPVCHCPSNIKDISTPEHNGDTWLHQAVYWGRRAQKGHRPDCFHPLKGPFKTISWITMWHDFANKIARHPGTRARWALEELLRNAVSYAVSYSLCKFSHIGFEPHRKPWKSLRRRRRPVMFCCVETTSRTVFKP